MTRGCFRFAGIKIPEESSRHPQLSLEVINASDYMLIGSAPGPFTPLVIRFKDEFAVNSQFLAFSFSFWQGTAIRVGEVVIAE